MIIIGRITTKIFFVHPVDILDFHPKVLDFRLDNCVDSFMSDAALIWVKRFIYWRFVSQVERDKKPCSNDREQGL